MGLDLDEWFWGYRPWDELAYFLDSMPRGSHYWAARASDVDMAESLLELTGFEDSGSSRPPLVGWTDLVNDLAEVKDLLSLIVHQNAADSSFTPSPRPETAIEVVKRERKSKKMSSIEAIMTGGE